MQLEMPRMLEKIDEIVAIYAAEENAGNKFEENIQNVEKDIFIDTATEEGIKRRETILGITAQDTNTLEERRFCVKTRWNDTYPYTYDYLMQRLDNLLGKGKYTLTIDTEKMSMRCMLELEAEKMYNAFVEMIEKIVPLNIVLEFDLKYIQQKDLATFKHKELAAYKHAEIRNRKVLGE